MKTNLLKQGIASALIALSLSACGGGSGTNPAYQNSHTSSSSNDIEAVYLTDLPSGYQLNGYVESGNEAGEDVKLIYCPNYRYSYYRGAKNFNGTYELRTDRDEVVMKDDAGGSYALQAKNGLFEVGNAYNCRDLRPQTTGIVITKILPHSCPGNQ